MPYFQLIIKKRKFNPCINFISAVTVALHMMTVTSILVFAFLVLLIRLLERYLCMNKKTCIRSVCSKRIIREEEIGYHVTPEITSNKKFILFPFALLLVHLLCCYIVLYQTKPTQ